MLHPGQGQQDLGVHHPMDMEMEMEMEMMPAEMVVPFNPADYFRDMIFMTDFLAEPADLLD